ncbi:MAG: hypothetical protein JWQ64_554 [Subtercola sp.]|nr:hypothetical protein [Subtercola sp.]
MLISPLSPYEAALGDLLTGLHPRLRAYFGAIPAGCVGVGSGVFDIVGSPRRWVRLLLRVLEAENIAFAVWQTNVPFRVENRPVIDPLGRVAVTARRTFDFGGSAGTKTMLDAITATEHGLVDYLGRHRRLAAHLIANIPDGELHLTSTSLRLHLGRAHFAIPRVIAPRVQLTERFDEADGRQHVSVRIVAPVIGTVYEYGGSFTYDILPDQEPPS